MASGGWLQLDTKAVGILGGMGPLAGHVFHGWLLEATKATRDQDHLHVVLDADPAVPDRTAYLLGVGEDPKPRIVTSAIRLAAAGAELLVMPCNTANALMGDIASHIDVPFVDWIETTVDAAINRGAKRVGVLATTGTIRTGIYQRALGGRGIETLVPNPAGQARVMDTIYGLAGAKRGAVAPRRKRELLQVTDDLRGRGADLVVLGCTELPLVLPASSRRWPVPALDPARAVATETVKRAGAPIDPRWKA